MLGLRVAEKDDRKHTFSIYILLLYNRLQYKHDHRSVADVVVLKADKTMVGIIIIIIIVTFIVIKHYRPVSKSTKATRRQHDIIIVIFILSRPLSG